MGGGGRLGVPLAAEKRGSKIIPDIPGLELDTVAQTSRLTLDKLVALKGMVTDFLQLCKTTLRSLNGW